MFPLAAILVQHPHAARGKQDHAQPEKNYFSNSLSGSEYAEVMLFFNITSDKHKHLLIFCLMVSYGDGKISFLAFTFTQLCLSALINNEAEPVIS